MVYIAVINCCCLLLFFVYKIFVFFGRYYWINNELKIKAVNAEFNYGYEYLGNSGRLVITPLTDRYLPRKICFIL